MLTKTILRLGLSLLLCIILLSLVVFPLSLQVLTPRLGQPLIVKSGDSFSIELKSNLPFWQPAVTLSLMSGQIHKDLPILATIDSFKQKTLKSVIPPDTLSGSYDLLINYGDQFLTQPKAIHVFTQMPRQLSMIQLADLPTLGKNGEGDQLLEKIIQEINLINPDVVLFSGDLAYGGSWRQYRLLLAAMEKIDAPVVAAPGNHEYEGWSGFLTLLGQPYHAITYGDYLFISINSGHGRDQLTNSQFKWLKNTLASNSNKIPIIQLHHPIFHRPDFRGYVHNYESQIVDMFNSVRVPIVLSGHWHGDAVYDNHGAEHENDWRFDGTPYVVTTAAGADLREKYASSPLHHGYRLIRLDGPKVINYTYDYDNDGHRDAASSIPVGKLNLRQISTTKLTVSNGLNESFSNAKVKMTVPAELGDLRPNAGNILQTIRNHETNTYVIGFALDPNSEVEIELHATN